MATRIIGYRFVVEGEGIFPFDMLRYDACWPHTQEDVSVLSAGYFRRESAGRRKGTLFSSTKPPTVDRWLSFGWRVSGIEVVR